MYTVGEKRHGFTRIKQINTDNKFVVTFCKMWYLFSMGLIFEKETYSIIGAAMTVHQELGNGFLEAVYQEALEKEFILRKIPYKRETPITIYYKNEPLNKYYIADFICYDEIVVELKSLSAITPEHQGQVVNYLTATKLKLGLLINFGRKSLDYKRIIK